MDPNKTQIGTPPGGDPNRTRAIPGGAFPAGDPNRTQAMTGGLDPLKTTAFQAVPAGKALAVTVVPGRDAAMANGPAREQVLIESGASFRCPRRTDRQRAFGASFPVAFGD